MNRRTMTALLAAGAFTSAAQASDAWTKDPASWDDHDIQRLLTDSPWARKVQVAFGGGGGGGGMGGGGMGGGGMNADAGAEGGLSGPGGGPGGGMGGGGRRGGGGMGAGMGAQARTITYVVRWMSALPVKQAFVLARLGKEAGASEQARQYIARQETHYLVAVVGPPRGGMGAGTGEDERAQQITGRLRVSTSLLRKGKPPIHPEQIELPKPGQGSYLFQFPRTEAITEADKEVEFATHIGPFEIKRKFKLKEMIYQGALAL